MLKKFVQFSRSRTLSFTRRITRKLEDDARKQNDEIFRKMSRAQADENARHIKHAQDHCEHIAGCNALSRSQDRAGRTAIVWHTLNTKEVVGLCTVCLRSFRETDPDFAEWRGRKSFSIESAAGGKLYDPKARQLRSRTLEEARESTKEHSSYDPWLEDDDFGPPRVDFMIWESDLPK